jgi:hypothetical protein
MSTISCTEFQQLLDDAIESRADVAGSALSEHADSCPECRTILLQHRLVDRAVAAWLAATPQPDLVEAVVARYVFDTAPPKAPQASTPRSQPLSSVTDERFSSRRQPWIAVAVAAVAVVAAAFTLSRAPLNPQQSQRKIPVVAADRKPQHSSVPETDEADVESLIHHAGSAYIVLANQTADAVIEASRAVAPTRIALLEPQADTAGSEKSGGWQRDLAPIGREFGKAFDFLFEAVPPETTPSI